MAAADDIWNENWQQWLLDNSTSAETPFIARDTPTTGIPAECGGSTQQEQSEAEALGFISLADWDRERDYKQNPPICILYRVEWKITMNGRKFLARTEQDVPVAPVDFWTQVLQEQVEDAKKKKSVQGRGVNIENTSVHMSVTQRGVGDVHTPFDGAEVDWLVVGRQLQSWATFFRAGKQLRVGISFNLVGASQGLTGAHGRVDKRGSSSATQLMLAERSAQLDAEEDSSQRPSVWKDVYNLMRCPGPPCHLGPWCWRDPQTKKHYQLKTHHMKHLVKYVEEGSELRSHSDIPQTMQHELYAEYQQQLHNHKKRRYSPGSQPPITINNVLPRDPTGQDTTPSVDFNGQIDFDLTGTRDEALERYGEWQESKNSKESRKLEFRKALTAAQEGNLDLELIHHDQDVDFFVNHGVDRAIARQFIRDVPKWVKSQKCSSPGT